MFMFADTQTTFYVVGIIFMIFWMVVGLVIVIGLITVLSKIRAAQKRLKAKMDLVTFWTSKGKGFFEGFMRGMNR
jgi:uncharacterized membrane protein